MIHCFTLNTTGKTIKSPGTLVISTYAPCPDIRVKITPDLKSPSINKVGELIWVNIESRFRLGGSALAQVYGQQGNDTPDIENAQVLKRAFNVTQSLLTQGHLLAGHDISDGGLIVTLLEMAFAGICGLRVDVTNVIETLGSKSFETNGLTADDAPLVALFAEECGWVLEVAAENLSTVLKEFEIEQVPCYHIGQSLGNGLHSTVQFNCNGQVLLEGETSTFFKQWERTSFELEKLQANPACAVEEYNSYDYRTGATYKCTIDPDSTQNIVRNPANDRVLVAVVREEGINGDREMIASLLAANFDVHDVTMNDLLGGQVTLDHYRGVVFPGGFSYADTLGSAKGWAASITFNEPLRRQFLHFRNRPDTFSLGVCNGCQLMSLLGWVGIAQPRIDGADKGIVSVPDVALLENKSERFECRWTTIKVERSPSILLQKLAGSTLGCWVAHGEGRFSFRTNDVYNEINVKECVALRYVDDGGRPTEVYPLNPNGSVDGIASVCSTDGRHLAMMPHPERCTQMWQWPYVPPSFEYRTAKNSPWQVMFDTAFEWCQNSNNSY